MKKIVKMLIIVVVLIAFTVPVSASEATDKYLSSFEEILPEDMSGITESTDKLLSSLGIDALISEIVNTLRGQGGIVAFFLLLIGGVAISAVCEVGHQRLSGETSTAFGVLLTSVMLGVCVPLFGELCDGLLRLVDFFAACVPIMGAVTASGGGVGTAAAQATGMNITIALLTKLLLPAFTYVASFTLALSSLSAFASEPTERITTAARSFFMWMLGIVSAAVMGAFALQTIVTSAADSARMRAAKYIASGMIPVVGGTVAGSLTTLASGLTYVKGIIGAGAVAVLVSVFISPLVILLLYRLAISLAASLGELIGTSAVVRVYRGTVKLFDLFIAIYTTTVVLCIFETVLFVASGIAVS